MRQSKALRRDLESRQARRRWKAMVAAHAAEATDDDWEAARRCACFACPTCRPDVAAVATFLDVPFLNMLVLVMEAESRALSDAKALVMGRERHASRSQRRRFERAQRQADARAKQAEVEADIDPALGIYDPPEGVLPEILAAQLDMHERANRRLTPGLVRSPRESPPAE